MVLELVVLEEALRKSEVLKLSVIGVLWHPAQNHFSCLELIHFFLVLRTPAELPRLARQLAVVDSHLVAHWSVNVWSGGDVD